MLGPLDRFLNNITMFRLLLYGLIGVIIVGALESLTGLLTLSWLAMLVSAAILTAVCWGANRLLAKLYGLPTNSESALITGLILFCILRPASTMALVLTAVVAGLVAMV